jgi:molybdate transport system regulatory protein
MSQKYAISKVESCDIMPFRRNTMATPVIRFRIDFAANSWVGPGKIELLEAVRSYGSLSQAARSLGMSYRRGWLLIESLNSYFREPVTRATTGGKGGGGMVITAFGESLIKSYRELSDDIAVAAARRLPSIASVAVQHPRSKLKSPARPMARKY